MKLEKAIEILNLILGDQPSNFQEDDEDALKLGIEALKRVQLQRTHGGVITETMLPGETEEEVMAR